MSLLLTLFFGLFQSTQSAPPPTPDTSTIIDGVDRTFARMQDFSADFVQIAQDSLNQRQQEEGHLFLMRPRKMRMEYKNPEEKLFVSTGKNVYWYVPMDRQVQVDKVKDALDDRIPLMFLVGRSNLRGEFKEFTRVSTKPVMEGAVVISMKPKRKTDLKELIIEVDPKTYQLRRLALTHDDGSHSEFRFSNIRLNAKLNPSLFEFTPPPGVRIVEGIGQ
jgi:outer membrane lipoprotein carrier protein